MRAFAAFLLLVSASAFAQDLPGHTKVAADQLKGSQLVETADNFALNPPAGEWEWFTPATARADIGSYTALDRRNRRVVTITVTRRVFRHFDAEFVRGVGVGIEKTVKKNGGSVEDVTIVSSNEPLPGARLYSATVTLPGRPPARWRALIFKRGYIYVIQDPSAASADELMAFARGFSLIAPPKIAPVDFSSGLMASSFGCFLVMFVAFVINSVRKRRTLNGATGTAYLIAAQLAATSGLLAWSIDRDAEAGRQGEAFGGLFGAAVIPLVIAIALACYFERRRVREYLSAGLRVPFMAGASTVVGIILLIVAGVLPAMLGGESIPAAAGVAVAQLLALVLAIVLIVHSARRKELARLSVAPSTGVMSASHG